MKWEGRTMTIFRFPRRMLAGLAGVLLSLGPADAGTISTPIIFLGGGNQLVCIANNVSTQAITVTVRIVGFSGTSQETCNLPAGDNDGCQAFRNGDGGHCRITSVVDTATLRARARGVLFSRRTTSPFTINALVQAE
jgi:hypothetical protein